MKFITTTEDTYIDIIVKHLRLHNFKFTGKVEAVDSYVYVMNDNELVAGAKIHLSWNWVSLNDLMYDSPEELKVIVKTIFDEYRGQFEGISFYTKDEKRKDDFIMAGFKQSGFVEGTPLLKGTYCLTCNEFSIIDTELVCVHRKEKHEDLHQILLDFDKAYQKEQGLDLKKEHLSIVAYDEDEFMGGVLAINTLDSMYIDLLVVNENYRKQGLGKTLMLKAEKEAVKRNMDEITLGTTEFQARPFYEKLGYQVVYTKENNPKGFKCFSLTKKL